MRNAQIAQLCRPATRLWTHMIQGRNKRVVWVNHDFGWICPVATEPARPAIALSYLVATSPTLDVVTGQVLRLRS